MAGSSTADLQVTQSGPVDTGPAFYLDVGVPESYLAAGVPNAKLVLGVPFFLSVLRRAR